MSATRKQYEVVVPRDVDVILACANLRPEDLQEVEASGVPSGALSAALIRLIDYWQEQAILIIRHTETRKVLALGGIIDDGTGAGQPWFLTTVYAAEHKRALWAALKDMSQQWEQQFPYQYHRTWVHNTMHQRLIKKLGYTVDPQVDAKGFAPFYKGVPNHV